MHLETISRPPTLVETVCQRLVEEISGEVREQNSLLPTERELALKMGVSRGVVREAAKRLEQQGLLEIRQGSGMRAVDRLHKPLNGSLELLLPDEKERLRQLVEVRIMIEPQTARMAAERATAAQIEALGTAHLRLVNARNFEETVHADMEFHRQLAGVSGNRIAALLLNSLSDLLEASLSIGYGRVSTNNPIKQHGQILKAVAHRDGKAAAKAMERHLETAAADLALEPGIA